MGAQVWVTTCASAARKTLGAEQSTPQASPCGQTEGSRNGKDGRVQGAAFLRRRGRGGGGRPPAMWPGRWARRRAGSDVSAPGAGTMAPRTSRATPARACLEAGVWGEMTGKSGLRAPRSTAEWKPPNHMREKRGSPNRNGGRRRELYGRAGRRNCFWDGADPRWAINK